MIQRIQTIYLALAVIMLVLCCCWPLATFEPAGMGLQTRMFILMSLNADGSVQSYLPSVLFAILVVTELVLIVAIFGYKNRKRQMKTCTIATSLEALWMVAYLLIVYLLNGMDTYHVCPAAFCPVVAILLTGSAHKAIKKDDDMVRAADRIR